MSRTGVLVASALAVVSLGGRAAAQSVVSPAEGAVLDPDARFVVVAPADARTTTVSVDGVEVGRVTGPGTHVVARRLAQAGRRQLAVASYRADGQRLGVARVGFVARGLVLRSLGGDPAPAERVRLQATPYGLAPARVTFSADGFELGSVSRAPFLLQRSFSLGGLRVVRATAVDGAGRALAVAELALRVAEPALTPPAARGQVRTYQGTGGPVRLDDRTVAMLGNARRWLASRGGCPPERAAPAWVTQGSYSDGVSASAGTHDGGGVIDVSVGGLDAAERAALVRALREAGFAAWSRRPPVFSAHIHAVAVGAPDLSPAARRQVADYFAGRDGLAGHAPDPHGGPVVKPWMSRFGGPSRGLAASVGP